MVQTRRWMLASLLTVVAAAAAWSAGEWGFGLDVATAATVAALAAGVVGTPMAAWAGSAERSPPVAVPVPPRPAGGLPPVWNLPPRSAVFTGRDTMLGALHEQLRAGGPVVVLALFGMGGVGKTSVAVEYAYRFADEYDLGWWVNAEQADLVGDQLAALGQAAGWVAAASPTPVAAQEVLRRLHGTGRWLVVFDNVDAPDDAVDWLPQGPGHVLITSRDPNWKQLATPVDVDVFDRHESVALLGRLAPTVDVGDADRIADAVGDLPLAVAQAGGVLAETGMTAEEYLRELAEHGTQVLSEGRPLSYPTPLAAAVQISLDRLAAEDPAAVHLLRLCALLAPEPVPVDLFTAAPPDTVPEPLASVAGSALALRRTLGRIGRYGLAKVGPTGPQLHRLVQAIIVGLLDEDARARTRAQVEELLVAADPGDNRDPATWPRWARLLPHLLAVDPAGTDNAALRALAWAGGWYLLERGDLTAGYDLSEHLYQRWRDRLGPDDPATLHAAHNLASARGRLGRYAEAHSLDADTLTRRRRVLGEDHLNTLNSATHVAFELYRLGRLDEAHALHGETLRRLRETHGEDHPLTMGVAHNLALVLRGIGRYDEALALNEDVLGRRRLVLGEDHPNTLRSAETLANDLVVAGRLTEAVDLHRDTLARMRRVLGRDHPSTLGVAASTATALHRAGRVAEALTLYEDTLARRSRVLGVRHPDTVLSAQALATALRAQGRTRRAADIEARYGS